MSIAKIRRPLLAALLLMGAGIATASAFDFCRPVSCRPAPRPVRRSYCPPPAPMPAPVVRPVCTDPCGLSPAPITPVNTCVAPACPLPSSVGYDSYGSTGYSAPSPYYSSTASGSGMLLIPTANGLIESDRIPITNEVDHYYATHTVVNGRVEELPYMAQNY